MSVRKRIHVKRIRRKSTVENALAGLTAFTPERRKSERIEPITEDTSPNPWPRIDATTDTRNVAIFTSGGDAQGMNAAVRASAAVCLQAGVKVFAIFNGYQGMVDGGDNIRELTWESIEGIMHKGGTVIGSARCQEFRTRDGRKKAAKNLIMHKITCLIAIGGDGSLTGANAFKSEWPDFVQELQEEGAISLEDAKAFAFLAVVGMVGSIDNDMCGFSMTIGCDSALTRICEAVDALTTTAQSHQRTFIIEVMGRNCGFLALMAAMACGADYVLIPEHPPPFQDWEEAMCDSLKRRRRYTNFSLIIVAEGATDYQRNPISTDHVKRVCIEKLGHDTRVTTLGHVQRGGVPTAYDRLLASRCGAEAAIAVLNATPETPARIVGVRWNQMVQLDLTEAVERTRTVGKMLKMQNYEAVKDLRGLTFKQEINIFLRVRQHHMDDVPEASFNILIFNTGAPAGGMNACARGVTRDFINGGHTVYAAYGGIEGVLTGDVKKLSWQDVKGWASRGGCLLGTSRTTAGSHPEQLGRFVKAIRQLKINGIVCIGGFEAYESLRYLTSQRSSFKELCIPMALIPATISNNVPGTTISLGADTALNTIMNAVDTVRQSAISSRRRAFVVETQGGYCGFLASLGALCSGADGAFIHEEGLRLRHLTEDVNSLARKFRKFNCAVYLNNEKSSESYSTEVITRVFEEEGKPDPENPFNPLFSGRSVILGHLQQGGAPSPLDRIRGLRFAASTVQFMLLHMTENVTSDGSVFTTNPDSAAVIGIYGKDIRSTAFDELHHEADSDKRINRNMWWRNLHFLTRVLENSMRKMDTFYQGEAVVACANPDEDEEECDDEESRGTPISESESCSSLGAQYRTAMKKLIDSTSSVVAAKEEQQQQPQPQQQQQQSSSTASHTMASTKEAATE